MQIKRGNRFGILVVGDSLPSNAKTVKNICSVLDPKHPVYNSLIVPIKYYINNYLNSQGYQFPKEKSGDDFFYYINAVDDPKTKSKPNFSELIKEINQKGHNIILCMGEFAFGAVETIKNNKNSGTFKFSISKLGDIFSNRLNTLEIVFPLVLPILHNTANRKFEKSDLFIPGEIRKEYISYFHYVGVSLGKLLVNNKEHFNNIILSKSEK